MVHHAPIIIVPPHTHKPAFPLLQHRIRAVRTERVHGPRLARGVRGHADAREGRVDLGVQLFEDGGDVEAVDEEGGAAAAFGVGEEVEELEAAGVGLPYQGLALASPVNLSDKQKWGRTK